MEERRSQVLEDRHAKLEELRRRGVEPFAYRYDVTHSSDAARALFAGLAVLGVAAGCPSQRGTIGAVIAQKDDELA